MFGVTQINLWNVKLKCISALGNIQYVGEKKSESVNLKIGFAMWKRWYFAMNTFISYMINEINTKT